MADLPMWAIGKHYTSVILTPLTVNTTSGALTEVTASNVSLFGHLDEINLNITSNVENISPINNDVENNVILETALTYDLTEFEKSVGTNLLASAFFATISSVPVVYWKFQLARGAQTFTGYGVMTDYSTKSAGKGSIKGSAKLRTFEPGGTAGTSAVISYA